MSTAVMSNTSMFECGEHLFKNAASTKTKDPSTSPTTTSTTNGGTAGGNNVGNGHAPLKRSYTSLMTTLIEQHRKLDRSVSEPTSRYKTELCRPYEESGSCKYGDKCQFAHGYGELRNLARHPKYKTELCRTFHTIGFCPYGPRCHFIHNFEEARIHNQKVSAQLGSTQPNIVGLNPLMSAAAAAVASATGNGTAANNNATANNVSVNVSLLEQLAASSHVAAAAAAAATTSNLMRTNSLSLGSTAATSANGFNQPPLLRTSSLSLATNHHHAVHLRPVNAVNTVMTKPKPLNLSPTFSLGSSADSVSPSSSLSQSPTNSMASFFSDDCSQQTLSCGNMQTTPFSYSQDFSLLACSRQSPSPRNNGVCSPLASDEVTPRTPSPLSPNTESRLPVFNRISSTLGDFDNLKI
ncbi:PREDICTED: protein TIS11 [Atta colombica]|uniref:protein TIS11 n=1 Tax=Atta colombica TaxID=520822 RepID=UPI00084C9904|nr:PREDICTED: protein TIS11 [Atta colombica]